MVRLEVLRRPGNGHQGAAAGRLDDLRGAVQVEAVGDAAGQVVLVGAHLVRKAEMGSKSAGNRC